MDVVLERILSLLPHGENGKIIRGAKKDFAQNIGYDSGDIVSMWIKGTSTSYKNKLHEIAAKYDVSVEWLRGETDEPGIKSPRHRRRGLYRDAEGRYSIRVVIAAGKVGAVYKNGPRCF